MNWNEGIERKELKWRTWSELIETNELTWMNWNEWITINELKWKTWNEGNDMEALKWWNWNEWLDMNELKWIAKSAPNPPGLFLRFSCETEFSVQSRAHFVGHFPDRAAHPRKQRASSGDHGRPLYPKKQRVLRPRAFSSVNSRVPERSHLPTTSWWCDWHDDVVDMMMWLTWWLRWWCGCHDGETASHWQSSVTRKFPI